MKRTIVLNSEATKSRAILIIESLALEPVHELVIRPHHVDYSDLQRGLYFDWCGDIGDELGYTKPEMHIELKRQFLVPIYMDNESGRHDGYRAMVTAIKQTDQQQVIMDEVVRLTSITKASMPEMRKYMDMVDKHAQSLAIRLRYPGDGYYEELAKRFKGK